MPARFARRLVILALVGGIAADVLFDRVGLGINVPLFVSAILLAALRLRPADARLDRFDAWLPAVAVIAAPVVALRHDPVLNVLDTRPPGVATPASRRATTRGAVTRRRPIAA